AALGLGDEPGAVAAFAGGIAFADPRLPALGVRLIAPEAAAIAALGERGFSERDFAAYDLLRLDEGVPDGSPDLAIEKTIRLEAGFDELNGVDWLKGCYIGQELTARTKYRGLVKKRLLPVRVEGALPAPGAPVTSGGEEVGELRSGRDGLALALLRLEAVAAGAPLEAGGARLYPLKSGWTRF